MKTEKLKAEMSVEGFKSKAEVAGLLNRSLKTVSNWMRRGILPYYKLGHRCPSAGPKSRPTFKRIISGRAGQFSYQTNFERVSARCYRLTAPAPGPGFTPARF